MALFPKEQELTIGVLDDAPQRMRWTRELGTRKLLTLLIALAVIWFVVGKVQDHFLLAQRWKPLTPDLNGMTVVAALNPRSNYEKNLFKILTENSASRVVLTQEGWNSIFDPRNGPLCSDSAASALEQALKVDNLAGYAMLAPYLRAAVAFEMGDKQAYQKLSRSMVVQIPAESKTIPARTSTLGAELDAFASGGSRAGGHEESDAADAGGSGSGRSVEQVITLDADTVAQSLPPVLVGSNFTDAWLEEQPENLLTGPGYTVHLGLTPEGRSRFFQWSHDHANESLVFVLNHAVVMAARMGQTLDVNEWGVTNLKDKPTAQLVVDYVNRHGAGH
jgi:hypothetical protein